MEARLHLIKGNPQGKQVEIPPGTLAIGRAEDSDLIIASTRVSRHHCEIVNDEKTLTITDKGSGNGTLVNGSKVLEQALEVGDEIQVGPLTFVLEIDGVRAKPGKPEAKAAPAAKAAPKVAPATKAAAAPKALAKPAPVAAKPKAPGFPPVPGKKPSPADVLSSLERLAGPKKPAAAAGPALKKPAGGALPAQKKDDLLEISDEDLIEPDK